MSLVRNWMLPTEKRTWFFPIVNFTGFCFSSRNRLSSETDFLERIIFISSSSVSAIFFWESARRCPSVPTTFNIWSVLRWNRSPLSTYLVSDSPAAYNVFSIASKSIADSSSTLLASSDEIEGQTGNSSGDMQASLKWLFPHLIFIHWLSADSRTISPSISRAISNSFFAGMHIFPSSSTLNSIGSLRAVSRSVAVIEDPALSADRRKLLSTGMVFRFSTMFWMSESFFRSSFLSTFTFIFPPILRLFFLGNLCDLYSPYDIVDTLVENLVS